MSLPFGGAHWVDHVARHAYARPDEPAIRFEGTTTTWRELDRRVGALAGGLAARGLAPGERVVVLMTNRPEFLETVLATNAAGAIAVPVNFRLSPEEVAYVLDDSGATVVVTDPLLAPLATAAIGARELAVIVAGDDYESVITAAADRPDVTIDERDVALIMYTSGTTGRPKGAMLTHLNLLMNNVTGVTTTIAKVGEQTGMMNVPFFHIAGIGVTAPALMSGRPTVIMPTGAFDAQTTLDVIEREQVTSLFLVPAQWQVLCAHPEATHKARSLQTLSWGAAPATVTLLQEMARVFPDADIVSAFGQTEMSPVTASLLPEDAVRKIGSIGKVVPLVAARIVDDAMNDVPVGEVGEIVYRGPTLMKGYWNKPAETAEAMAGGWFHSGDLVRQDDEGFLYVVDRKKDMIISGGENIYCAEVENALAAHPGVADVAVIGARHERWGETPVAVVVAADPSAPPTHDHLADLRKEYGDAISR
jgi:fatty-acyl-CoA synthase